MAANRGKEVHHLDVKTAFSNGEHVEDVYVLAQKLVPGPEAPQQAGTHGF